MYDVACGKLNYGMGLLLRQTTQLTSGLRCGWDEVLMQRSGVSCLASIHDPVCPRVWAHIV